MPNAVASCSVVKRPSRWREWLRALEFSLQMILGVSMVCYGFHSYQVRTRLQAVLAELDRTDPDWRLQDIEAARAVVPDAENSALTIVAAGKSLPTSWMQDNLIDELSKLPPERRMTPDQYVRLSQNLDGVRAVLEEARRLEHQPRGRFPIVYMLNPISTPLPGLQKTRELSALLMYDARARAEAGDTHGAFSSCRAVVNAGRSIGDEPAGIAQLVRAADMGMACATARRLLAQTEPDEADLKTLQDLLEEEDTHPYWQITCRGERAIDNSCLEALESGELKMSDMMGEKPDWQERLAPFIREDNMRACHPQLFTYMARLKAAGETPPYLRKVALQQIDQDMAKYGVNMSNAFLLALPKLMEVFDRCHAIVRTFAAVLAVERYRRMHGDWPESLKHLTPHFLATVPTDPYTGEPLLYVRRADGVIVYSVGKDGTDDGGDVDPENPTQPSDDLGVHLWNVASRRQPPMPPALPALPR